MLLTYKSPQVLDKMPNNTSLSSHPWLIEVALLGEALTNPYKKRYSSNRNYQTKGRWCKGARLQKWVNTDPSPKRATITKINPCNLNHLAGFKGRIKFLLAIKQAKTRETNLLKIWPPLKATIVNFRNRHSKVVLLSLTRRLIKVVY